MLCVACRVLRVSESDCVSVCVGSVVCSVSV